MPVLIRAYIRFIGLFVCIILTTSAFSAVPSTISYQGYLTDPSGIALDGPQSVEFSIYNVNVGGVPQWNDTQSVSVNKGLFSIQLGGPGAPFPLGLFDNPLWLGININGDGEMSPRVPFDSTAFAFNADDADTLEGQSAASLDQSAHVADSANPHSVTAAQTGAASTADITTHAGDDSAHHTEYTDADAQGAMGVAGDANTLNHVRYADAEATAAIFASDGSGSGLDADTVDGVHANSFMAAATDNWVNTTGDTMSGALIVNAKINTTAGYQIAGFTIVQASGDNIFLGYLAGSSNTTGNSNVFSGFSAGDNNTTGDSNTFTGRSAGGFNTTGSGNTFTGEGAGLENTTASANTFTGSDAGRSNTTGTGNTFSGAGAGKANTTGTGNVFLGFVAGEGNTTGYSNTFSGAGAGGHNTTGYDNVFSGTGAGGFNATGAGNIFSGRSAGKLNTTGNNNTFIGSYTGNSNTTGENNTFVGHRAGSGNIAGHRNVFLGKFAGSNETGSDKLYIDNSTTSTPLIWGDFSQDYLDVHGRLHAKRPVNDVATPANHVAIFENTSTGTSADVLALKIGMTTNPGLSANFISFFNGNDTSVGAIQGNNAGSVTLAGAGNDYAEYLPRIHQDEVIVQGDIVGVISGKVSKNTRGASRAMVVSSNPIVSGNDPGQDQRSGHSLIAFIGQSTVNVRGIVKAGDYLIPDGKQQGVGIAISPETISAEQFTMVVGQAWESSTQTDVKQIRALVGLQHANPVITKLVNENRAQAEELTRLRADLAGVIQQVVHIQKTQQQQMYAVTLE